MNKENNTNEIDLMQVFGMIQNTFRSFLKLVISVVSFYKKKALLFLILLIVGIVGGYFIERNQETKDQSVQEVIIEPKYNSVKYIYDFIDALEDNFQDEAFLNKLGIKPDEFKNIKEITIEPIVKGTDVLDNLQERYKNREFFKDIMQAYQENQLEEDGFRDFYKHHRLVFKFKNKNKRNGEITSSILKYIKSNKYYQEISELTLRQNTKDIERNKASLKFIDTYLSNLEKSPLKAENEAIIVTSGAQEMPMISIASLLQKKELLIELINDQERALVLDKEMFSFVDYGDVISKRKELLNRMIIIIPILLMSVVSLFFFLKYLSKSIHNFVRDEE